MVARGMLANGDLPIVIRGASSLDDLKKTDGDPIEFVRRLCGEGGLPTDSYIGVPMTAVSPVILVETKTGKSRFESLSNVSVTVHRLSRSEKTEVVKGFLDEAGVRYREGSAEFLVDNYCLDDGIAMINEACNSITRKLYCGEDDDAPELCPEFIQRILPDPDEDDPRTWLGRKRAALERMGGRYSKRAEGLLERIKDESYDADISRRRLKILLGALPAEEGLPRLEASEVKVAIEQSHPGLSNADALSRAISTSLMNEAHKQAILLLGPAGTGKTTIVRALADSLNVPFAKFDMPGMSDGELYGQPQSPSLLVEAVAEANGKAGFIVFDEIDKASHIRTESLCSVLDEGIMTDFFTNVPAVLGDNLMFLTANDLEKVSPYIVNRCMVVEVPGYTPTEKVAIAEKALLERTFEHLAARRVTVSREALEYFAEYDDDAGLRNFEKRVRLAVSSCAGNDISLDDAKRLFPAYSCNKEGVRVIMPRSGSKGGAGLCLVNAHKLKGAKGLTVLLGTTAFERVLEIVKAVLSLCFEIPDGVCASISSADDIEGTNCLFATLGTAVAVLLATEGEDIDLSETAFVGDVEPTGWIKPVDENIALKVPFIVARARVHGIRTIVCPASFAELSEAHQYAQGTDIDFFPVEHISQVFEYVKGIKEIGELVRSISK